MCRELCGHIWWRRGWSEITSIRKIPCLCMASLLSTILCFPCIFHALSFTLNLALTHQVRSGRGWGDRSQYTATAVWVWSTVVWHSQLLLALSVGLSPFCHCYFLSFPLHAIAFKKQNQYALGKPNRFWKTAVLSPRLCNANFPVKLIFQNADTEFLFLPSLMLFNPLLLELQLILSCVVAKSQSTAPALTCGWNDSSSFHTLVHCSRWGVSLFLFHY